MFLDNSAIHKSNVEILHIEVSSTVKDVMLQLFINNTISIYLIQRA